MIRTLERFIGNSLLGSGLTQIKLGKGCLLYDYKHKQITDGNTWYRVASPSLIIRLWFNKVSKRNIDGEWILIGNTIILFKKIKYIHQHVSVNETYHRKDIGHVYDYWDDYKNWLKQLKEGMNKTSS